MAFELVQPSEDQTGPGSEVQIPGGPDDYSDDTGTSGYITVDDSVSGEIEVEYDEDWFAFYVPHGEIITITLTGIDLYRPILTLYDGNGNRVLSSDEQYQEDDFVSEVIIRIPSPGTYYLGVEGYWGLPGTYELSTVGANWIESPTSNPLLNHIDWGTQVDHHVISVYFAEPGDHVMGYDVEGFTDYEREQFQLAFDIIESYTNVQFVTTYSEDDADFVVGVDLDEIDGDFLGMFNPPGEYGEGDGIFDGTQWDREGGDLVRGGYGFVTIVHELLHGLGLAHPHDDGGTSTVMGGVTGAFDSFGTYGLNQGVYTIMGYNSGWYAGPLASDGPFGGGVYGFEGGPMALDIAALQENYGTNETYASGNNAYLLPSVNDIGTYFTAIWDTGGADNIHHSGSANATIDLRPATITEDYGGGGYVSSVRGIAGGFTIAHGVVIENAYGGLGNDLLVGNDTGNDLWGFGGADRILGGDGADTIMGGAGRDRLVGQDGDDLIEGGTDRDTILGMNGDDIIEGNDGNDVIRGGDDQDLVFGGVGNDLVIGGVGRDTLYGETGDDTMRGTGGFDTVDGGVGNDSVFGGAQADLVLGGEGNDTVAGGGGYDTIDGGLGDDSLTGNFNADRFVFDDGHGNDTISDFESLNMFERIDLSDLSTLNTLSQVFSAATQIGTDVLIVTGADSSILLENVDLVELDSTDFIF